MSMEDEEGLYADVEAETADSVMSLSLQKKDKTCLVCGDKALGYNFNAVSCESCKAFFRRNAHKTIRGRCEGTCEVTVDSRSFCKKCRLHKCFSVGMRKDMILNEEQKKQRKQKIIINKLRKHGQLPPEDTYAASPQDFADTFQDQIRNQSFEDLRSTFPRLSDSDLLMLMKLKSENESESCPVSADISSKYPAWNESQDLVQDIISQFPDMEKGIIIELRRAHEQTEFLGNTQTVLKSSPKNSTDFVNVAEGFVRRIIKLSKYIEFFKMINKEDQIGLLKGSVVEILMLRSAVNFDAQTETWSLSTKKMLTPSLNERKSSTSTSTSMSSEISSPVSPDSASSSVSETKNSSFRGNSGGVDMDMINSMREHAQRMGFDIESLRERAASFGFDVSKMAGMGVSEFSRSADASAQSVGIDLSKKTGNVEKEEMKLEANILKMGNPETQSMFLTYSKFVKSLMRIIHGDLLILKLLIMLSLFSADRPGLQQQDKIQEIQECYAKILQRYVKDRFPEDSTLFAKIIMKLTDLRNINEVHTKMLLKMKLDSIEPLLIEIFDLPS
ncbi:vitamin D3 receptor B-like [Mytilus californianus]|uniref:vitamin D3 receptor B-like n=1 Tax=Mytilus californianus TaxID=6549 RepID=UPI002246E290|nr:vitamin D3 receptor B-like [Mytilus californianus]